MSEYFIRACACIFLLISLVIQGCKEDDGPEIDPSVYPISVSINPELGGVELSWTQINTRDFQRYWIIRSVDSLPDDIDVTDLTIEIAGQVDQPEDTVFTDTRPPQGSVIYYKVLAELGNRFLVSPTVPVVREFFPLGLRYGDAVIEPIYNTLFVRDQTGRLVTAFDYEEKKLLGTSSISSTNPNLSAGTFNGQSELYVHAIGNSELTVFRADSMFNPIQNDFLRNIASVAADNRGRLYIAFSDNAGTFRVHQRAGFGQVANFTGGQSFSQKLVGVYPNGNDILDATPQQVELYRFDDNGDFITRITKSISAAGTQFLSSMAFHPDGEFVIPFRNGLILDKDLNPITLLSGNVVTSYAFSPDGNSLYVANGNTLSQLEVPSFRPLNTFLLGFSTKAIFVDPEDNKLLIVGDVVSGNNLQAVVEIVSLP
ncbi:MAG: hypothetical protein AAGI38_07435 [Bacteroidota bacterium]